MPAYDVKLFKGFCSFRSPISAVTPAAKTRPMPRTLVRKAPWVCARFKAISLSIWATLCFKHLMCLTCCASDSCMASTYSTGTWSTLAAYCWSLAAVYSALDVPNRFRISINFWRLRRRICLGLKRSCIKYSEVCVNGMIPVFFSFKNPGKSSSTIPWTRFFTSVNIWTSLRRWRTRVRRLR